MSDLDDSSSPLYFSFRSVFILYTFVFTQCTPKLFVCVLMIERSAKLCDSRSSFFQQSCSFTPLPALSSLSFFFLSIFADVAREGKTSDRSLCLVYSGLSFQNTIFFVSVTLLPSFFFSFFFLFLYFAWVVIPLTLSPGSHSFYLWQNICIWCEPPFMYLWFAKLLCREGGALPACGKIEEH